MCDVPYSEMPAPRKNSTTAWAALFASANASEGFSFRHVTAALIEAESGDIFSTVDPKTEIPNGFSICNESFNMTYPCPAVTTVFFSTIRSPPSGWPAPYWLSSPVPQRSPSLLPFLHGTAPVVWDWLPALHQ